MDTAPARDRACRRHAAFDKSAVTAALAPGDAMLHDEERVSVPSRKRVRRLVVRRAA